MIDAFAVQVDNMDDNVCGVKRISFLNLISTYCVFYKYPYKFTLLSRNLISSQGQGQGQKAS